MIQDANTLGDDINIFYRVALRRLDIVFSYGKWQRMATRGLKKLAF